MAHFSFSTKRLNFEIGKRSADPGYSTNPENPSSNPASWNLDDLFGHASTSSGISVNEEVALTFSAVYGCVRIISQTLASLPFNVYRQDGNSKYVTPEHPLYNLIHSEPNDLYTSFEFRETVQAMVLLWGNGYAKIIRGKNFRPVAFKIYHPRDVEPYIKIARDGTQWKEYKLTNWINSMPSYEVVMGYDMIHVAGLGFDGIKGKSPIQIARENIGLGLAQEEFGGDFFKNHASFSGVFENPGSLSKEAHERLKKSLATSFSGRGNRFQNLILESGMKFSSIGIPPEQAQWIASRKFQIEEIARIYGVQLHKLANLDRSTNNNIEAQNIEFVVDTMRPWCVKWEQEFNRKAFRETEKGTYYTKLNLDGLMRGDSATRANYYQKMYTIKCLNPNEIRELEDRNPYEGGDVYYNPLNEAQPAEQPVEDTNKEDDVVKELVENVNSNGNGKGN